MSDMDPWLKFTVSMTRLFLDFVLKRKTRRDDDESDS